MIGFARYDASNLRYSLISDFLRISSYNGTSGIKTPQIQKNTDNISVLQSEGLKVGVKNAFTSDIISTQQPFYDNLQGLDKRYRNRYGW